MNSHQRIVVVKMQSMPVVWHLRYQRANVFGTWNMVQAAEECGAKSAATLFHFKPQSPVDIPLRQAVEA